VDYNPFSMAGTPFPVMQPNDPNRLTTADAYSSNKKALIDWIAAQRADASARGLWNDTTGMPTQAGMADAMKQYGGALVAGTKTPSAPKLPVRGPSEDVFDTMQASFVHGRNIGPRTVKIDSLNGGVALNDPAQAARISQLKEQMSGPNGFISRPIVDTEGNVIEGQHRLEALRQLGIKNVPVHVVQDLAANIDTAGLHSAIKEAQPMHGDQRTQLIQDLLESVQNEGSPAAVRQAYDPPAGYGKAWNAALGFLEKPKPVTTQPQTSNFSGAAQLIGPPWQ
jgi:ParB-like nuclease family protein